MPDAALEDLAVHQLCAFAARRKPFITSLLVILPFLFQKIAPIIYAAKVMPCLRQMRDL